MSHVAGFIKNSPLLSAGKLPGKQGQEGPQELNLLIPLTSIENYIMPIYPRIWGKERINQTLIFKENRYKERRSKKYGFPW